MILGERFAGHALAGNNWRKSMAGSAPKAAQCAKQFLVPAPVATSRKLGLRSALPGNFCKQKTVPNGNGLLQVRRKTTLASL